MTRRPITPDRAERLRIATAQSVLEHLKAAGGGVPANILAQGLAVALVEMLGHVNVKHRAEVTARCRAALEAAEAARGRR